MKKTIIGLATAVLLAVPVASANAALNAYLKITGSQTKSFTPDAPSGFQPVLLPDSFMQMLLQRNVQPAQDGIVSPRDPASGLPTGRRTYEPIRFSKRIDKSSPLLARAMATGEHFPKAVIVLYRETTTGTVEFYAEVTLTNCVMSRGEKASMQLMEKVRNGRVAGSTRADSEGQPMESFSLNYTKIEWTYVQGTQGSLDYPQKATYNIKKNVKV